MNNFEVKVLEYLSPTKANEGVNNFIGNCNKQGLEILDMTSHVSTDSEGYYCYTFIFKLKWNDERAHKNKLDHERM